MKNIILFIAAVSAVTLVSCNKGAGDQAPAQDKTASAQPAAQKKSARGTVTPENLIGEWECIDITNGMTHMESIAKMQPHMVFNAKNEISSKMKLSNGTNLSQKTGSYKIEDGAVASALFDQNAYMENGNLIIEDNSADNKRIYKKVE